MKQSVHRRLAAVAALAVVGFTAACSAESSAAPPDDTFMQCLTDNGVPAPPQGGPGGPGGEAPSGPPPGAPGNPGEAGPPPAPPGIDQGVWDAATAACQSLAPTPPR